MSSKSSARVEMIPTDSIKRNPENPRIVFDEAHMDTLRESIHSVGILVPLIMYKDTEDGMYALLDGERRWRCAQDLNLPTVPANVIPKPSRLENILRMFNIHNVREAWTLTETAWKLKTIMDTLESETGKTPTERVLATLTGLTISGIRRCKKMLSFPLEYQQMVLAGKVKSDFFVEMQPVLDGIRKKFPDIFAKKKETGIIDHFLKMSMDEPSRLENVTDFRFLKRILEANKRGADPKAIRTAIVRLFQEKTVTLPSLYEQTVKSFYDSSSLERKCIDLLENLEPSNLTLVVEKEKLIETLAKLRKAVDKALAILKEVKEK